MKPAATFATPIDTSSCDARTCSRRFPANARAVRISSANETRKSPNAAGRSATTSERPGVGIDGRGQSALTGPTIATPWLARSTGPREADGRDDHDERAGQEPHEAAHDEEGRQRHGADRERGAADVAELAHGLPQAREGVAGVDVDPEELPSCAITSVIATPCRYPISTGREK